MRKIILMTSLLISIAASSNAMWRDSEMAIRFGLYAPLKGEEHVDLFGGALDGEYNKNITDRIGLSFRGTFASAGDEFDESYVVHDRYGRPYHSHETLEVDYYEMQLSLSLYASLIKNDFVNFYLLGGGYFIAGKLDADTWSHDYWYDYQADIFESDCHGFGFQAGAGLRLQLAPQARNGMELKMEVLYFSEPSFDDVTKIEDEEGQILMNAAVAVNLSERVYIDFGGRYFTKWEDIYFLVGFGAIF